MSRKLRIIALILVSILTLSIFAGCDKDPVNDNSSVMTQSEVAGGEDGKGNGDGITDGDGTTDADGTNSGTTSTSNGTKKPSKSQLDINETGWPIVNKPITFEIMTQLSPSMGDPAKMSMFSYLKEKTNVNIKAIPISDADRRERKTLALQSGDLPDAFAFTWNSFGDFEIDKYSREGAFVDVKDLLPKYAPNINKEFKENPVQNALNVTGDGKVVTLPNKTTKGETTGADHFLNINKTWLDNLGLEIPTTTNEFLEVLRAFRDYDPNGNNQADEIPLALYAHNRSFYTSFWGSYASSSGYIDVDNNYKVFYALTSANAKAACEWWYALVNEPGLIDIEITTTGVADNYTGWKNYIKTGKVGCFLWKDLNSTYFSAELLKDYVAIPYPTANFKNAELNLPGAVQPYNRLTYRGKVIITKACSNVPALLRYFDYLYTDEGIMVGNFGAPSAGLYTQLSNGKYQLTAKGQVPQSGMKEAIGWCMAIPDIDAMEKNTIVETISGAQKPFAEYYDESCETYNKALKANPKIRVPNFMLSSSEIVKLRAFGDTFSSTVVGSRIASYIISKTNSLQNWVTDTNDLEKKGLSKFVAIYHSVVDRNKKYLSYAK